MNYPDDPQLPENLIAELQRRDAQPFADTSRLDEQLRLAADEHFAPADAPAPAPYSASWRFRRRLITTGLAAAAAVGLIVWLNPNASNTPSAPVALVTPSPARPHDFNQDGSLDILDVMQLARHVENALPSGRLTDTDAAFDVNLDQRVDARDIQTLGRTIVRLAPVPGKDGEV